ncbi:hypothetical protein ACQ4LE_002268 [Meloidogyne hapla]|uniref:Cwf21 domain-containing protein n=1 Tax=Meloidogyne hapla TaxID=6305 RepID=A0A1I8BR43_MELHA
MYNNVGLSTARGSGTNAYVQSNVANLSFSRNKIVYNAEEDIARAEAEVNKAPNLELLDHEYKRLIEIKCVEFEDLMEGKGFSEEETNLKVSEYRKLLFNEFESGRLNMDAELDLRNSHSRAKVAKQGRSNMRWALGIDASFVDGSSMEKLKKASTTILKEANISQDKATLEKEMEKSMMEKLLEKIKKKREQKKEIKNMKRAMRKKKKDESDSSSSDSDSSDSSSTNSSSSDDSSNDSYSSLSDSSSRSISSSSSSDNEKYKKRKKEGKRGRKFHKKELKKPKSEGEEQISPSKKDIRKSKKQRENQQNSELLVPKEEPQEAPHFTENRRRDHKRDGGERRAEEEKDCCEDRSRGKNLLRSTAADFFDDEGRSNSNNLPAQYRQAYTSTRERNRKSEDDFKEDNRKRRHGDDNRDRYRRRSRSREHGRRERKGKCTGERNA